MTKKLYGTDPDQVPTNADLGTMAYQDSGNVNLVKDSGTALTIERQSDNGDLAVFKKDTTTAGSIGTNGNLYIQGPTGTSGAEFANNTVRPWKDGARVDATVDLGTSDGRFKDLYLSGDVIAPNIVPSNGIFLGGTTNANKLDDYETGDWVPVLEASTTNPTPTYTKQQGRYTKIGDVVHCSIDIRWSAVTAGTGSLQISGLPSTSRAEYYGSVVFEHSGSFAYPSGFTTFGFETIHSTTKLGFILTGSSASTVGYDATNLGTGSGYAIFSFTYKAT